MAIEIPCDKCGKVLEQQGGLYFGPPIGIKSKKYHICVDCHEQVIAFIKTKISGHEVTAEPVYKMDSYPNPIGYRYKCSCGRVGNGVLPNEKNAIAAGMFHIK